MDWLNEIKWNADGLVPAIAQDADSGKVMMMAWMNPEALALTVKEQRAIYWSRSRGKLWRKGEESGHVQTLIEIRIDCDKDAVLLSIKQQGGVACHTGRESCFFYTLNAQNEWQIVDEVIIEPALMYKGQQ